MRRAGFLFIALFALLGCPPSELSASCHFQGETTACGKCIQTNCQSKIDTECASYLPSDVELGYLDQCASGQDCSRLFSSTSSFGSCAKSACAQACTKTPDAVTSTGCRADAQDCICCQDPSSSSSCSCLSISCRKRTDGSCICGAYSGLASGETVVSSCRGNGICCLGATSCTCSTFGSGCSSAEETVTTCSVSDISPACGVLLSQRVTSCP